MVNNNDKKALKKPGAVEYQMPRVMAEELLRSHGKSKQTTKMQDFLVNYVNVHYGLKNHCTRVTLI